MLEFTNPTFEDLRSKEWLITNGIGGYASGTLSGANSRRYHGLLVASSNPPTNRKVLIAKLEESIGFGRNHVVEISANQYPNAVHPKGYKYLKSFEQKPFPTFKYEIDGQELQKTIFMVYGRNATVVEYKNLGKQSIPLTLTPFLVDRDYHGLFKEGRVFDFYHEKIGDIIKVHARYGSAPLYLKLERGNFEKGGYWIKNLEYEMERYRGLDFQEDAHVVGQFHRLLNPNESCFLVLTTDANILEMNPLDLKKAALKRMNSLKPKNNKESFLADLSIAADQFVVRRNSTNSFSILAGYHWFTDWGRDTMIALRGIAIASGKQKVSQSILKTFFDYLSEGMLPNRFPDNDRDEVEYNTVDATLWLFIALFEYHEKFKDDKFIKQNFDALTSILKHHFDGTRYNIHVTAEGFLWAGEEGVQLTWMDAKVNGYVVTPREGCAVEIQALWYNSLMIYQHFYQQLKMTCDKETLAQSVTISTQLRDNFKSYFYNEDNYLNDVIIPNKSVDTAIRPNQIFALSLPYSLLTKTQEKAVFKTVKAHLFTPLGLRSLNVDSQKFKGHYGGNQWDRDTSYHQGTVWSFLLGDYWLAYLKLNNFAEKAKTTVKREMSELKNHFYEDNGINGISEIFDGFEPKEGRGTVQQAWSIGALLMVLHKMRS